MRWRPHGHSKEECWVWSPSSRTRGRQYQKYTTELHLSLQKNWNTMRLGNDISRAGASSDLKFMIYQTSPPLTEYVALISSSIWRHFPLRPSQTINATYMPPVSPSEQPCPVPTSRSCSFLHPLSEDRHLPRPSYQRTLALRPS